MRIITKFKDPYIEKILDRLIMILLFLTLSSHSYSQIYDKLYFPKVDSSSIGLELTSIDLSGPYLKVNLSYRSIGCIQGDTYIVGNNIRYLLLKAENINICDGNNDTFCPNFSLYFEKLDPEIRTFDIIEPCSSGICFNIFGVNLDSVDIERMDIKWIEAYIQNYVEEGINNWQIKGEFEKTLDFKQRVTNESRKKKIIEFEQTSIKNLKIEYINGINWKQLQLEQYDADNETYLIKSKLFGDLVIPVDIETAPQLKDNWENISVNNPKIYLSSEGFKLSSFEVLNPMNNNKYIYDSKLSIEYNDTNINYNFDDINLNLNTENNIANSRLTNKTIDIGKSDIDINIPLSSIKNYYVYALVIGNEDYKSFQPGLSNESNVDFAVDDAKSFIKYLNQTIGVPEKNIISLFNATGSQMKQAIEKIRLLSEVGQGKREIVFYYSGHGLPGNNNFEPYLIPVDVNGTNPEFGIKLDDVYQKLTEFPNKKVTVFLDACFSGGARNKPLVAMRNIKVEPKQGFLDGNIVVFASSSGNQSSGMFLEKQHGLFTYYLLMKIQETKGNITYKELSDYLIEVVQTESLLVNDYKQTPTVRIGIKAIDDWENWKIK